jgi:hypothetical protein
VPEQAKFAWDQRTMYFGSSLQALVKLAKTKGYTLVGCNYTGVNAFFVRTELVKDKFKYNKTIPLYQKPFLGGYIKPGYPRSVNQWN